MKRTYKKLGEVVYYEQFANGYQAMLLPNQEFEGVSAAIVFNSGSAKASLDVEVDGKKRTILPGIAHFLEHRIFEYQDKQVFDLFSALGASCNAFTSFEKTVYYFKTIENATDSIKLLLEFTSNFSVNEQKVEQEKPIIIEEVNSYKDYPDAVCQDRLLKSLYFYNPIKYDIGGDEKSIKNTTVEDLVEFHQLFYHPENALLVITGNFDLKEVKKIIAKQVKKERKQFSITKPVQEPLEVKTKEVKEKMDISIPSVALGIKLKPFSSQEMIKKELEYIILLDILFSSNSKVYDNLLKEQVINTTFNSSIYVGNDFTSLYFYSESNKKEQFFDKILEVLRNKNEYISKKSFINAKNMAIGQYIRSLDNPGSKLRAIIASSYPKQYFDAHDYLKKMKYMDILKLCPEEELKNYSKVILEPHK